jgi:hypothetical protein
MVKLVGSPFYPQSLSLVSEGGAQWKNFHRH